MDEFRDDLNVTEMNTDSGSEALKIKPVAFKPAINMMIVLCGVLLATCLIYFVSSFFRAPVDDDDDLMEEKEDDRSKTNGLMIFICVSSAVFLGLAIGYRLLYLNSENAGKEEKKAAAPNAAPPTTFKYHMVLENYVPDDQLTITTHDDKSSFEAAVKTVLDKQISGCAMIGVENGLWKRQSNRVECHIHFDQACKLDQDVYYHGRVKAHASAQTLTSVNGLEIVECSQAMITALEKRVEAYELITPKWKEELKCKEEEENPNVQLYYLTKDGIQTNLKCAPGSTILDLYAAIDEPNVYLVEEQGGNADGTVRYFILHFALLLHKRPVGPFEKSESNAIAYAMATAYETVLSKKDEPIV